MKTVVILLSDKRSGSTMLQEALCSHPKIQTVKYSPHTYLETQHWLKGAVLLEKNKSLFSNGKLYKNYGSRKNARIYLEDELKSNLPDFIIPKDDKQLVFQGWDALCEKFAKPIFFEKSPQHLAHWAALSLLLEWAHSTTKFEVKFIGLIRNPLAVQYSAFKLFHTIPEKRQFGWLEIQKNLMSVKSFLNDTQFLLIRYENIVDHPQKSLIVICKFLGITYSKNMASKIHGDSKTKWNEDPYFSLKLDDSVIQMAKNLGYNNSVLTNNNDNRTKSIDLLIWKTKTKSTRLKNKVLNRFILPLILKFK